MIKHRLGFTLIEIVVAVAIFGVIMSIVFPTLVQFLNMRERLQEKHQELTGLQKAFLFMANDLRYAANRLGKDEYGEAGKTTLSIDEDHLIDLTALYPDVNLNGISVPRRLRWMLEDDELRRIQYPVMDPDSATPTATQTLLRDVENVEVEVSFVEDGRNNTDRKWDQQSRLPELISIKVEFLDGVEFRRVFTMVGGDGEAAIAAGTQPSENPAINPSAEGPDASQEPANAPSGRDG